VRFTSPSFFVLVFFFYNLSLFFYRKTTFPLLSFSKVFEILPRKVLSENLLEVPGADKTRRRKDLFSSREAPMGAHLKGRKKDEPFLFWPDSQRPPPPQVKGRQIKITLFFGNGGGPPSDLRFFLILQHVKWPPLDRVSPSFFLLALTPFFPPGRRNAFLPTVMRSSVSYTFNSFFFPRVVRSLFFSEFIVRTPQLIESLL